MPLTPVVPFLPGSIENRIVVITEAARQHLLAHQAETRKFNRRTFMAKGDFDYQNLANALGGCWQTITGDHWTWVPFEGLQ